MRNWWDLEHACKTVETCEIDSCEQMIVRSNTYIWEIIKKSDFVDKISAM